MNDDIHGYRVTDRLEPYTVNADDLKDMFYESHAVTMLGELVVILTSRDSDGDPRPLNVITHLAVDRFVRPIRGTALVFGLDLGLDGGMYGCIPDKAVTRLEDSARMAKSSFALEFLRKGARATALEALALVDATDELEWRR